jgi:hypothetical protein
MNYICIIEHLKAILNDEIVIDTFYVMQFTRGESVDSRQRSLLPVKSRASHLQGDDRSGVGEEEVRLLAEHGTAPMALGYVAAVICGTGNSIRNRKILSVLHFVVMFVVLCK